MVIIGTLWCPSLSKRGVRGEFMTRNHIGGQRPSLFQREESIPVTKNDSPSKGGGTACVSHVRMIRRPGWNRIFLQSLRRPGAQTAGQKCLAKPPLALQTLYIAAVGQALQIVLVHGATDAILAQKEEDAEIQ